MVGLTWLLTKLTSPSCGKPSSPCSPMRTGSFAPLARGLILPFVDRLPDAQEGRLVHVEVGVHRVERDDRGQQRLVLVDQVAEGQVVAADHAVDRRDDPGEFLVQLVDLHVLLEGLDPRLGLLDRGLVLVELLLADGVGRDVVDRLVPSE